MAVGHCYYFLEDIFPNQPGGWKILKTPQFLRIICDPAPEVRVILKTLTKIISSGSNLQPSTRGKTWWVSMGPESGE